MSVEERFNKVTKAKWTRKDYQLLMFNLLVKFGDSVEIYLPGVITQTVASELNLSKIQEGFLGVTMYITMAAAILIVAPISDRFGRRPVLLTSLYTSILFTLLCAVVPNYGTLLLSRGLIGLCVGLNMSTAGIFYAEHVSDRSHYTFGTFLTSFVFAAGGGWVALLGFLLLDLVGWRIFVMCTSIPLFVPPIMILHCCIKAVDGEVVTEEEALVSRTSKDVIKGYGSILLLPGLIREENKKRCMSENRVSCNTVVDGNQFLILALVTGVGNLFGRGVGYLLIKRIRFRILQPILAVVLSIGYLLLLFKHQSMVLVVFSMALCKIVYSMMRCETSLISFDPMFFGTETIAKASAIVLGCGMVGSAIGNGCSAFLNPYITVQITFALSIMLIGVVSTISERNSLDFE
ncbi:hypothetical protein ACHWQZ_G004506 [Mnemiopsis leidyi]